MDPSFDLDDINMSNAPSHTEHRKQSPQGGRGNNQKTCNNCGQQGHFARSCNAGQNYNSNNNNQNRRWNGQNNNGGNANGQQNKKSGSRTFVDPANTRPGDPCYMHPKGNHVNELCSNPQNIHNTRNNQNRQHNNTQQQNQQRQSVPQDQQPKPQQNRHGNIRSKRSPLSGAEYNYCERCNVRGHTVFGCTNAAPVTASYILVCRTCKNPGHSHTDCKHPAFCANCKALGHSRENCHSIPALETLFYSQGCKHSAKVFPHFQSQSAPSEPNRARFADAKGNFVLDEPMNEAAAEVARYIAWLAAERKRRVGEKCRAPYSMYRHQNINDLIAGTAEDFARCSAEQLEQQLPASELKELMASWFHERSLHLAHVLVRQGHSFYRDPRAMQGIADGSVPKCNGCAKMGLYLNAAFFEIKPGADVLGLHDWNEWGPMVQFACRCSGSEQSGYEFVPDTAGKMETDGQR